MNKKYYHHPLKSTSPCIPTPSYSHGSTLPNSSRASMSMAAATALSPCRFPVRSVVRESGTRATPRTPSILPKRMVRKDIGVFGQSQRLVFNGGLEFGHGRSVPRFRNHDFPHQLRPVFLPCGFGQRGAVPACVQRQSRKRRQRVNS